MVPDEKARPVGVGEDNEPLALRQAAEQGHQLVIVKDAETGSLQDHRVHHLG